MAKWQRFRYFPCLPLGKNGTRITGSAEHITLSRRAAAEGMVLLKNDDNILPICAGNKVALFGKASVDYVKGGGGSGDVTVEYVGNLCAGIEQKQAEGKLKSFLPLNDFYKKYVEEQYQSGILPGKVSEPTVPYELLKSASEQCDVAIISICRYSRENTDRLPEGDFTLTAQEQAMVSAVTDAFDRSVVVLNVGGVTDTSWFYKNDKIKGVLLGWQAGMEGGFAEADIICGDVCPSGRLSDTFAAQLSDYPSTESFSQSDMYVEYTEDIFVGYRYFETIPDAAKKVNYPFGFGLSYTDFNIETLTADQKGEFISIYVRVTNTGKCAGKEVVQVYTSSPNGILEKPAKELRAFAKTDLLAPNESCYIQLSFAINDMCSYDEKSAAYIMEAGTYSILIGNNARDVHEVFCYNVPQKIIVQQLKNRCVPKKLSWRLRADGSCETLVTGEYDTPLSTEEWPEKPIWCYDHIQPDMRGIAVPEDRIRLEDVADGKATLEQLIAQMTTDDLIDIVGGRPSVGVTDIAGMGDMPAFGIPTVMTADGPAGLRIQPIVGISSTAWPCATLLACTWNTELVRQIGQAGALEVKENNIGIWLTPALNIHRNPLCGRNFEYYSEDPYLSGKMASAMISGIQSQGISACIKHFCCNNKEANRMESDSRVSERALREIYLKGFEIALKEAHPMALMTSYNLLNGTYTSENSELIRGILRDEWEYDGLVVSDWGNLAEQYRELLAGNNIRMPTCSGKRVQKAMESGLIDRTVLEYNARYVLEFILKFD